jgi:hypothetical protein
MEELKNEIKFYLIFIMDLGNLVIFLRIRQMSLVIFISILYHRQDYNEGQGHGHNGLSTRN